MLLLAFHCVFCKDFRTSHTRFFLFRFEHEIFWPVVLDENIIIDIWCKIPFQLKIN